MRAIVDSPDFLDGNYLSSEMRVPATLLRTNACSPLATNALGGNIWDNFSSTSYKSLPSVGSITVQDPFDGTPRTYEMPAGGRGYTRVPSLVSLWSTAPYLLNNAVGPFDSDPSVAGRMRSFEASIEQMLWPEKRPRDSELGSKVDGVIDRTTARSFILLPASYLTAVREKLGKEGESIFARLADANGNINLGPIPQGMPVNLLANLRPLAETRDLGDLAAHYVRVLTLLLKLKTDLLTAPSTADDAALRQHFAGVRDELMALNKCPDFVVNRGHYFGTAQFNETSGLTADERAYGVEPVLGDDDKRALIAFLKTL
jgi:hypothetical protein